ncbi:efflux RND transporter periplasmic adaptor subunit [Methyloversatilis universalis]|uniref:efflux RND transporter periplasmic adaptor subunit n=1 Tax=Methyloversatilis universalis TaxID=378211 RepID=UPI00036B7366|nr:efflux RND transporter periplasmic adaptor subunit [Methyloversatilis universalis]
MKTAFRPLFRRLGPVALTLTLTLAALLVAQHLWVYYTRAPWTRDGRVRADVVRIAPDVSGLITAVKVRDNQPVKRGELLFVIDRARYELALRQAQAEAAAQRARLAQARREAGRNGELAELVSAEAREAAEARVQQGEAALAAAEAAVGIARLNLERTEVRSPVDGWVSDHLPRAGDHVTGGQAVLSVVDAASFHVDGYFEETKLDRVRVNQPVDIRIMGESRVFHGHVQSIAAGIEDRERSSGASLLPNVNPAFNWVRLAQRIPVRIALDETPSDLHLVAGRTATVEVREQPVAAGEEGARS